MAEHAAPPSRKRITMVFISIAALIAVPFVLQTAQGATETLAPVGRTETCVVDTAGGCTVAHGFGVVPSAVLIQPSGAQGFTQAVVNPSNVNDTTYRVVFFRSRTSPFPAGTVMRYFAHYDFAAVTTPPTTPVTSPPTTLSTTPSQTPPTTPPSTPPSTPPVPDPSPVKTCTNGVAIPEGAGRSFFEPPGGALNEYFVHNNNWNDTAGGTTTITACNYDNWFLVSNTPDHSDLSVQTYPNVHRDYNNAPLSTIQSARFAANSPRCAGCIYNVAFDIWIGSGFSHELMIWTENVGQRPAGSQIGTTTIGGQTYQVWRSGSGDGGILTYVATPAQLFGTMPLSLFFADVRARGWTPTTTWQVDFGVEIVDTNGTPQRINFTDFYINDTTIAAAAAQPQELSRTKKARLQAFKGKFDSARYPG
jgi:Glycosyl hydrolase family 12